MMKNYFNILISISLLFSTFSYASIAKGNELSIKESINQTNGTYENVVDKDTVNIAFQKIEKSKVVGAVTTLSADKIREYDNEIWTSDVFAGRTLGMMGNNNIRGIGIGIDVADLTGSGLFSGNAMFVVDGLPRDIESLRLSEIENITVLKDANAAILYGSAAVNGVILITTKRGKAFDNYSNFTLNYGLSMPRATPNYLNSADYMTYNNSARQNDGLNPIYSEEMIDNYRNGNQYRYPDVDYYSDEYLKSFRPFYDLNGEFGGGNDVAKYYMNFGMNSVGSLLKVGQGAKSRNNTFNVRGNIDLKIIDWIDTSIDATAQFGNDTGSRGNYWSDASNIKPFEYTPLIPISMIDPENSLLLGRKNDVDGQYLLGGNINRQSTPFGNLYSGGVYETIDRKFSFNNRINFKLDQFTEGLSFHTNISFDYYTRYNQTVSNDYSVYEPIWSPDEDTIIDLKQYGVDTRSGTQVVGNTLFRRRMGFSGILNYDRLFDDIHHVSGTIIGFGSTFKQTDDFQGVKQSHLGLRLGYDYENKYFVDFSGALVNSTKLASSNRLGLSPSLGLAWMMSEEDFMKSIENIDLLKLRLSGGIINSDLPIGGFFYYDNRYGGSGSYNWYEGTRSRSGVMSNWEQNLNLGFAKRNNLNFGFEGLFFNKLIGLEANVFYDLYTDLITRPSTRYPGYYSDYIPYENYEEDAYKGVEAALTINKTIGDWNLFFGANVLYSTSERKVVDEVYDDAYQYRKGNPRDATFGLEALGLFKDQAEIDNSPLQSYGKVQPGDIKYKDQNNDGIIDSKDEVYLRRWQAPFSGGLQAKVSYKNLSLYVLGEGRTGSETFMEGNYYWVDGDKKYSEMVLNSWTPETAQTATYPRLSSQTNNNNFRRSSFWLYSNDYFQIRRIQLTFKMPDHISKKLLMNDFHIFADASNVFEFAKNKKVRETRVGGQPYYRTFSIGVKTKF